MAKKKGTMSPGTSTYPCLFEPQAVAHLRGSGLQAEWPELKDLLALIGLLCDSPQGRIDPRDEKDPVSKPRIVIDRKIGRKAVEIPLDACFCSQTTHQDGPLVVTDLRRDPRFCDHILVREEPHLRFYAGYPLITGSGADVGCLCVCDTVPRQLTVVQQKTLSVFARQIVAHIELKQQLAALEAAILNGIQKQSAATRELEVSESRFRAFANASPVSVFIKDDETRMLYCNKALADRFGATPEEWIGTTDFEIWPREIAEEFRMRDLQALESNGGIHFEDRTLGPDGRPVIWDVHKYPFVDANGNRCIACMALDVTKAWEAQQEIQRVQQELRIANGKLRILSRTDPLTGLMNRRALEDCLEIEYAHSLRYGSPLSLLMLDIDSFKAFNDSFGHVYGDEVLRRISVLIQQWKRKGDLTARYGGEEFLVILPDTAGPEAIRIAERLRETIAAAAWQHRSITVSIGIASRPETLLTVTELIHAADEALYAAKHAGRNRVCQNPNTRGVRSA